MKSFAIVCLSLSLYSCAFGAIEWHDIQYQLPPDSHVTSFTGTMVVPPLPRAGVYYIWPGLQNTNEGGVYQDVLDGRSGKWWMGGGWVGGNLRRPWGDGFNIDGGDTVLFSNVKSGVAGSRWTTTLTNTKTGNITTNSLNLGKRLPQPDEDHLRFHSCFHLWLTSSKLAKLSIWSYSPSSSMTAHAGTLVLYPLKISRSYVQVSERHCKASLLTYFLPDSHRHKLQLVQQHSYKRKRSVSRHHRRDSSF